MATLEKSEFQIPIFCTSSHFGWTRGCCVLRSALCARDMEVSEWDVSSSLQKQSPQRSRAHRRGHNYTCRVWRWENKTCNERRITLCSHPSCPSPAMLSVFWRHQFYLWTVFTGCLRGRWPQWQIIQNAGNLKNGWEHWGICQTQENKGETAVFYPWRTSP